MKHFFEVLGTLTFMQEWNLYLNRICAGPGEKICATFNFRSGILQGSAKNVYKKE